VGFDEATGTSEADESNRLLRKAETVIQRRTSRIMLVIERSTSSQNYSACLRTAEALGIQHVWCVDPPSFEQQEAKRSGRRAKNQWAADAEDLKQHVAYARQAAGWLTLRDYATTTGLIAALRAEGWAIWCTDLSQHAVPLTSGSTQALPDRVAICFGTEVAGVSCELLAAADKRVYLPLHGFADSLNLSVACAMVLQRLFDMDLSAIGDMAEEERQELRQWYYPAVARGDAQKQAFADIASSVNQGQKRVVPFGDLRRPEEHRKHLVANCMPPPGSS